MTGLPPLYSPSDHDKPMSLLILLLIVILIGASGIFAAITDSSAD